MVTSFNNRSDVWSKTTGKTIVYYLAIKHFLKQSGVLTTALANPLYAFFLSATFLAARFLGVRFLDEPFLARAFFFD